MRFTATVSTVLHTVPHIDFNDFGPKLLDRNPQPLSEQFPERNGYLGNLFLMGADRPRGCFNAILSLSSLTV
jgi:hypothetical protein